MAKRGRKCMYEELVEPRLDEIAAMIEKGQCEKQVAQEMGVSYSSWKDYKNKFPAFLAIIKKSTHTRNKAIVDSLVRLATGGYVTETKAKTLNKSRSYIDQNGNKVNEKFQEVEMVKETRYIEPNAGAGIFLAKNFMPEEFSDNPQKLEIDREKLKLEQDKAKKNDFNV